MVKDSKKSNAYDYRDTEKGKDLYLELGPLCFEPFLRKKREGSGVRGGVLGSHWVIWGFWGFKSQTNVIWGADARYADVCNGIERY